MRTTRKGECFCEGEIMGQDTRIAVIGIIIEDKKAVEEVNRLLHQ